MKEISSYKQTNALFVLLPFKRQPLHLNYDPNKYAVTDRPGSHVSQSQRTPSPDY